MNADSSGSMCWAISSWMNSAIDRSAHCGSRRSTGCSPSACLCGTAKSTPALVSASICPRILPRFAALDAVKNPSSCKAHAPAPIGPEWTRGASSVLRWPASKSSSVLSGQSSRSWGKNGATPWSKRLYRPRTRFPAKGRWTGSPQGDALAGSTSRVRTAARHSSGVRSGFLTLLVMVTAWATRTSRISSQADLSWLASSKAVMSRYRTMPS